jgi:LemA protein
MILGLVVVGALLFFGLIAVLIYNGLVRLRNKVDESWSGIDVQLKRRHDLVPNLVNTVKGYATHESSVLENVVKARQQAVAAHDPAEAAAAEGMLSGMLRQVFALSEAYPNLKANENFLELQRQLSEIEDELSASRRIYNGNVQLYNTKIQVFPNVLIAGPAGFTRREFFEITEPTERDVVSVQF